MAGVPSTYTIPKIYVLSESMVEVPAQMFAFVDGSWFRDAYLVARDTGSFNTNWRVNFCRYVQNRNGSNTSACTGTTDSEINRHGCHLDGVNASYMDGHAKWDKVDHFYNGGNNYPVWQGWR